MLYRLFVVYILYLLLKVFIFYEGTLYLYVSNEIKLISFDLTFQTYSVFMQAGWKLQFWTIDQDKSHNQSINTTTRWTLRNAYFWRNNEKNKRMWLILVWFISLRVNVSALQYKRNSVTACRRRNKLNNRYLPYLVYKYMYNIIYNIVYNSVYLLCFLET